MRVQFSTQILRVPAQKRRRLFLPCKVREQARALPAWTWQALHTKQRGGLPTLLSWQRPSPPARPPAWIVQQQQPGMTTAEHAGQEHPPAWIVRQQRRQQQPGHPKGARLGTYTVMVIMVSLGVLLAACGQSASGKGDLAARQHSDARTASAACGTPSRQNGHSDSAHAKNSAVTRRSLTHSSSSNGSSGNSSPGNCKNTTNASITGTIRPLSSISVNSVNTSIPGFQHLVAVQGTEAQAALSAWYAEWLGYDKAFHTMDWNYPSFVEYEGSAQLARMQKWMQNAKARGYIGVGHDYFAWAMVTSISSSRLTSGPGGGTLPQNNPLASVIVTSAVIKACIVSDGTPVKATTGKPMPGYSLGVITGYVTATMVQVTGRPWKDAIEHLIERNTKQCEK